MEDTHSDYFYSSRVIHIHIISTSERPSSSFLRYMFIGSEVCMLIKADFLNGGEISHERLIFLLVKIHPCLVSNKPKKKRLPLKLTHHRPESLVAVPSLTSFYQAFFIEVCLRSRT